MVTHRLNPKLFPSFFFPAKRRRERERGSEVNLRRCSCLPWLLWIGRFLKLSKCFTAPCLCRDSVRVHTCEESRATDGLASLRLTSPQNSVTANCRAHSYWWWLFCVPLARPTSALRLRFISVPLFTHFVASPSLWGRKTKQVLLCKASAWELCASYLWTDTLWVAPRHREGTSMIKDSCLLQSTIDFHRSERKTFMEERRKGGFLII